MEVSQHTANDVRRFGRYVLAQPIAHGGMASVHLAQLKGERNFSKWVAVKVVHPHFAGDPKFEKMFFHEARLLARIDHPNVCTVFDFGEVGGLYYLAMEYLHGQTLYSVMRHARSQRDAVSYECAARIIADAADGLHAAHELTAESGEPAKVVHRDVSPQNLVVLYSGVTKVLDFGIARSDDREEELTSADELKGKLPYMAPEQLRREQLDRRTDVFSLGIVLWELTCGRRLFRRQHEGETVVALLQDPIPRPSSVVPAYPVALEHIVMSALNRSRDARYQTAADMARDLEEFIVDNGKAIGHPHVADAMRALFGREIDEHTSSLRRSAELLRHIDEVAIADLSAQMKIGEQIEQRAPSYSTTAAARPSSRSRVGMIVAAAVLAAAAAAGTWSLHARRSEPVPASATTTATSTAPVASRARELEVPATPVPATAPSSPPPSATAPSSPPPSATAPSSPPSSATAPSSPRPSTAAPTAAADAPAPSVHPAPSAAKKIVPFRKAASAPARPLSPHPLPVVATKAAAAPAPPKPAAPTAATPAKPAAPPASSDDKAPRPMTSFE